MLRYKELARSSEGGTGGGEEVPFDISGHLTEIDTGKIDADYMNTRFDKYLKTLQQEGTESEHIQKTLDELHKSFASLTQEEQKYANIFLHEVQSGDVTLMAKTFREYITDYQYNAKYEQITAIVQLLGLDQDKLTALMSTGVTASNINEFGRFDELKSSVDKVKAKDYFEQQDGAAVSVFKVNIKVDKLLQDFIINDGFANHHDLLLRLR